MWNKTSCAYSKNAKGSVNSAAHNNSASSASVRAKRHADYAGTRCNGSEKAHEPLVNTGYAAENLAVNKMTATRSTGIAKILRYNAFRFRALRTTQIATHQLFDLCSAVEKQQVRSGQSELKILVSVVRFRPRPPFRTVATVMWLRFSALWHCIKHAVSTLPPLGTGCGTL